MMFNIIIVMTRNATCKRILSVIIMVRFLVLKTEEDVVDSS